MYSYQTPFGFELEVATLSDVLGAFGEADRFEIPDSHHQFGVCYFSSNWSEAIVIFVSGREFGGPQEKLLGVTIQAQNAREYPCAASELNSTDLVIGELTLGHSRDQFESLSTKEVAVTEEGYWYFDLEYRRTLTDAEQSAFDRRGLGNTTPDGIDVGLGIWSKFDGSRAVEIAVWQISTY